MSDFRTKLLGLAGLAMAFAGMSFGQTTITCPPNGGLPGGAATTLPSLFGISLGANPSLRLEGETELVSDVGEPAGANCVTTTAPLPGGVPLVIGTTGEVIASLSAPITSKAIPAGSLFLPNVNVIANSEALLIITDTAGTGLGNTYSGFASGNNATFSGVTFPSSFTFHIYNIRVNAAASASATVNEAITLQWTVGLNTSNLTVPTVNGQNFITVGTIQQSLVTTINNPGGAVSPPATFTAFNYLTCLGNPLGKAPGSLGANLAFTVNVKELIGGAFKLIGQEGGSWNNGVIGAPTAATQFNIALTGIPASATVYAPVSIVGANGTTLTLIGSVTGLTTPPALVGVPGVNAAGVFGFTATGNALNITYAVTAEFAGATTYAIPVYVVFAASSAPVQTAITVLPYYFPAVALTALPTQIPTFGPTTTLPVNAELIGNCQTTLLFTYVTNYQGTYETGIEISNTTTDNIGTARASSASSTPGTCTLDFYGNAAQPKSATYPPTGTMGPYSASPAQLPFYADTLSDLIGAASTFPGGVGFSGYAIANCNFPDAHGVALITDYNATNGATSEAIEALVIPNVRAAPDGGVGH